MRVQNTEERITDGSTITAEVVESMIQIHTIK